MKFETFGWTALTIIICVGTFGIVYGTINIIKLIK